nr:hypothetical protein [Clostridia bacterium]
MEWQKYLDIIADKLRELGITDAEMSKPLRTFEQFLIDNDGEELRESLDDPEELDDFVQNLYMLILKRRQKKQQSAKSRAEATDNTAEPAVQIAREPQSIEIQAEMQPEVQPEIPAADDSESVTQQFPDESEPYDMNETVTVNRVTSDAADSDTDNSETRTIDAVNPYSEAELQSNISDAEYAAAYPAPEHKKLPETPDASVMPVELDPPQRKLTRAEKKYSEMHMYEDIPPISSDRPSYAEFDPSELDREVRAKGSPLFWILFILTLPVTAPIIAALGLAFIAVFIAMAVLIVGFFALLAVDVTAG